MSCDLLQNPFRLANIAVGLGPNSLNFKIFSLTNKHDHAKITVFIDAFDASLL